MQRRAQAQQTGQWDMHPVRPIVQLIPELIQRLVDDEALQQRVHIIGLGRQESRAASREQIGAKDQRAQLLEMLEQV